MKPWLLIGLTMRPLAAAAARFAHAVCVIDACADRDTRLACQGRVVRLATPTGWRIEAAALGEALATAARRFAPDGFAGCIVGSGFEARPELLAMLASGAAPLCACDAASLNAVREPRRWFGLLDRIGAPHPPVAFERIPPAPGWLVKSAGGSGGRQVRRWRPAMTVADDDYFQQHRPGRPASALFVADGTQARIIGWQWQRLAPSPELPWRYGGVINATGLAQTVRERVTAICTAIVAGAGLRGIAGLDFLVDGEDFAILEANPRPTASIALHPQHDFLAWQVGAVRGTLPEIVAHDDTGIAGEAVLYAERPLVVAENFDWPSWCADIPAGSARFAAGQPICTVRGNAGSSDAVEALLTRRLRHLSNALEETICHDQQPTQRQHPGPAARRGAAH